MNVFLVACLFLFSCDSHQDARDPDNTGRESRSMLMGFTPWLYEASFTAQDFVYDQIQQHGDVISHHLMGGIPWQQALDGTAYSQSLQNEISTRLDKSLPGKSVYLSIDSLNGRRTELAPAWGGIQSEPRAGDWVNRDFDSPEVIQAYRNFAFDMIERFNPLFFNYAVEVSGLMVNNPVVYKKFVKFADAIYSRAKAAYPALTLLVSLSLKTPGSSEMQTTLSGLKNCRSS